ncbi:MAG: hypothetical protein Q3979_04815 [Actinomycetaceae bacterium]|nr:hypothetical protein [Actinomycetaceae bacterium]
MHIRHTAKTLSFIAAGALVLAGCSNSNSSSDDSSNSASSGQAANDDGHEHEGDEAKEVSKLQPRVVLSHDGGLVTLDGTTGKVLAETKHEGFLRLNPAGDGRHVLVTDSDRFRLFDTGLIKEPHEDHFHYYTKDPELTKAEIKAPKAGHVVTHDGYTSVFSDGKGTVQTLKSDAFSDGKITDDEISTISTGEAHHGVAVPLGNGNLLVTKGTEDERNTIQLVDEKGNVIDETTDCPGIHGEAAAQHNEYGDVVSFGCTNGSVVFRDGAFHKVPVPEEYQRSGNQFGSEASPITLTDYKVDEDAELERPTRIGLLDTTTATMSTVDLGSAYWFRSLARGENGEALVLTYDGNLNIIDPNTGEVTRKVKVVEPWKEKSDWQEPGPNVKTSGDYAYVTEPASKKLHMIQISTGELLSSWDLKVVPNEMAVVNGDPEAPDAEASASEGGSTE